MPENGAEVIQEARELFFSGKPAEGEKLIADKLLSADWEAHMGKSSSVLVNASTWGLMLTGKLVELGNSTKKDFRNTIGRLVNRSGDFHRRRMGCDAAIVRAADHGFPALIRSFELNHAAAMRCHLG